MKIWTALINSGHRGKIFKQSRPKTCFFVSLAVEIIGGVRHRKTLGGPVALVVKNRDHGNWGEIMSPSALENAENSKRSLERPRPGHADLVGGMKYRQRDLRNVLERSSARETTLRVALGNICEQLLRALGIELAGYVARVGSAAADDLQPTSVKAMKGVSFGDGFELGQKPDSQVMDEIDWSEAT